MRLIFKYIYAIIYLNYGRRLTKIFNNKPITNILKYFKMELEMSGEMFLSLRRLHGKLYEANIKRKLRKEYKKQFRRNPKTVFLLLTPEYGNLGDHAIAKSTTDFLRNNGINFIEITERMFGEMKGRNQVNVFNGFPILIIGGGNMGTLWMNFENSHREIVQKNPKSSIWFLPNTIFYENNEWGQEELHKTMEIYNRHKHLKFFARERHSFEFMKTIYKNVDLIPDMVLFLDRQNGVKQARKGCLLCLRSDIEKTRTEVEEQLIRRQATELFGTNVANTDMIVPGGVTVENRDSALQMKFNEFAGAELVITDRLHGMIFCAITGTPCIVVNSKSPKVRGCYEWIKELDYIRFADDVNRIASEYGKIPKIEHIYVNSRFQEYYDELAQAILNEL